MSNPQALGDGGELLAAAVDDSQVDADLLAESYLLGKRVELLLIFRDFAGELDDKGLVLGEASLVFLEST